MEDTALNMSWCGDLPGRSPAFPSLRTSAKRRTSLCGESRRRSCGHEPWVTDWGPLRTRSRIRWSHSGSWPGICWSVWADERLPDHFYLTTGLRVSQHRLDLKMTNTWKKFEFTIVTTYSRCRQELRLLKWFTSRSADLLFFKTTFPQMRAKKKQKWKEISCRISK